MNTIILTLETAQAAELQPLTREAYDCGTPVFCEVLRSPDGTFLRCVVLEKATAREIQRILSKTMSNASEPC